MADVYNDNHFKLDPLDSPFSEDSLRFWLDLDPNFSFEHSLDPPHHVPQLLTEFEHRTIEAGPCDSPPPLDDPRFDTIPPDNPAFQENGYVPNGWTDNQEEEENPNVIPLSMWPPPPIPFTCTCCQVLRDIVHSNGIHTTKLEIHGRIGLISHAILGIRSESNGDALIEHQFIDFSMQCLEDVKQYLTQYCQQRKQAGFFMLQDPLLTFYGVLCVGLGFNDDLREFESNQNFQTEPGTCERNHPNAENSTTRLPKSNLAAQRERTGRLKLSDLVDYFHLPIEVAAKKLEICPTVLKKICRKHGMRRWPHRKIKSMDKKILNLELSLGEKTGEERALAWAEIERLKQERDRIRSGMVK